jgi:hypothetical protein
LEFVVTIHSKSFARKWIAMGPPVNRYGTGAFPIT